MRKGVPSVEAELLRWERVEWILEGQVRSRSEPDRVHQPRILIEANFLCTCNGSIMRDVICHHLQTLLSSIDAEELREWVMQAQVIPKEISADVDP